MDEKTPTVSYTKLITLLEKSIQLQEAVVGQLKQHAPREAEMPVSGELQRWIQSFAINGNCEVECPIED